MKKSRICAAIVENNPEAVRVIEPLVDLFEVRIDLIGDGWRELAGQFQKPWIACNRRADEGGRDEGDEASRMEKLLEAAELGADMVDVELRTPNLESVVELVKKKAECILSLHDLEATPTLDDMKEIVQKQLTAGADICKVVTTARKAEDSLTVLRLISEFPGKRLVALAMGPLGLTSRVLCPLVGGDFTYASIERGKKSASGQITVKELVKLYETIGANR